MIESCEAGTLVFGLMRPVALATLIVPADAYHGIRLERGILRATR